MLAESYRVLQVPFGAEMPQIRTAYRKLVLQYHPDRNRDPAAPDMFLRVQAAYEYLQRFQQQGASPATAYSASTPPPKPSPEAEWEKYQYVYEPPAHPDEYAAWARVARERVRRQKEKDQADYVARTQAMKLQWWYGPARISSYGVMVFGCLVGLIFIVLPFTFLFGDYKKPVLLAIIMVPMGLKILDIMRTFRGDIRKHFGEDLPPVSK